MNKVLNTVKIFVEDEFWSRAIQHLLSKEIGAKWGMSIEIPWNTARQHLVIVEYENTGWWITWATMEDFNETPGPVYSAKALWHARPNQD